MPCPFERPIRPHTSTTTWCDRAGSDGKRDCRPLQRVGEASGPDPDDGRAARKQSQADKRQRARRMADSAYSAGPLTRP